MKTRKSIWFLFCSAGLIAFNWAMPLSLQSKDGLSPSISDREPHIELSVQEISPATDDVFWDPRIGSSGPNGRVYAMKIVGDDLYVGGTFSEAGGITVNNIAKWDGRTWSSLGDGVDGQITTIEIYNGDIFVGGGFHTAGGVQCEYLARWDGSQWHSMGGVSAFNVAPPVRDMIVFKGSLYVAGTFRTIGDIRFDGIARWNGIRWLPLRSGLRYGTEVGRAFAVDTCGGNLFVGGQFDLAGGIPAQCLAKWDGREWYSLGNGFNGSIYSLDVVENDIYAGGSFRFDAESTFLGNIARWDGARWHAMIDLANNPVWDLDRSGAKLYSAGTFTQIGGVSAQHIAVWNGQSWSGLGSGLTSSSGGGAAFAIAQKNENEMYIGGSFEKAGGRQSRYLARWYASTLPNFSVFPHAIQESLYTGQTSATSIVINNRGDMVLDWWVNLVGTSLPSFEPISLKGRKPRFEANEAAEDSSGTAVPGENSGGSESDSWLSVVPRSGTFYSNDSTSAQILFNARGLRGGNYEGAIQIINNDPREDAYVIPVHLVVTDAPDISLSDTMLAFGVVPVGSSYEDTVFVLNVGTDTLHVASLLIDEPGFSVSGSGFIVPPGDTVPVEVSFTPDDEDSSWGTLSITSDDPDDGVVLVSLAGTGKFPVSISVAPDSLYESLYTGFTSTQTLTIDNTGPGTFDYTIALRRRTGGDTTSAALSRYFESIRLSVSHRTGAVQDSLSGDLAASIMDLGGVKIVFDRSHEQEPLSSRSIFVADLVAQGAIIEENVEPITIQLLDSYDIFWSTDTFDAFEPEEIDALTSWVMAKGSMLLIGDGSNALSNYNNILSNLGAGIQFEYGDAQLGTTSNIYPHETTFGVEHIYLHHPNAHLSTVSEPATRLVDDSIDNAIVAASVVGGGKIVTASEEIFNNHAVESADNQLFGNRVIFWFAEGVRWLSVSPDSGSMPVQENAELEVRFDATEMPGGEYDAEIIVISTSWDSVMAIVPIHLVVTPAPDIVLSDTVLVFDPLYVGARDSLFFTIYNVGNDTLFADSISVDSPCFAVDTTSFTLLPGKSIERKVMFHPMNIGLITGMLQIKTNDPDERMVQITLEGESLEPPLIVTSADSLNERLLPGEASLRPLIIYNYGGADLLFWIHLFDALPASPASAPSTTPVAAGAPGTLRDKRHDGSVHPAVTHKPEESAGSPQQIVMSAAGSPFDTSTVFYDNFEDQSYDGWFEAGGTGTREVTDAAAANDTWYSYHEYGSSPGHFDGLYRTFGAVQPAYVSFWVRSADSEANDAYFVLRSSTGEEVIWFFASSNGTFYLNASTGGDQNYVYSPNTWYHIEFTTIDFESNTFDYYVNDSLIQPGVSFRSGDAADDIYRLDLHNYSSNSEAWWDEIFLSLTPQVDWVRADTYMGTVASDSAVTVALTIDAAALAHGSYDAIVHISTNIPLHPMVSVPVHLDVDSTLHRTLTLPLDTGWNLVSWNVDTPGDSVHSLLDPIMDRLVVAHGFDQGGLTYSPGLPPEYNTLGTLQNSRGVWLKLSEPDTLVISGSVPHSQVPVALSAGYNLVSYLPYQEDSVGHAFASVLTSLEYVFGYEGLTPLRYQPLALPGENTLLNVKPGSGYWLKLSRPDTLRYPGLPVYPSHPPFMTAVDYGGVAEAGVTPTTEWVNVWGDSVNILNDPIEVGTVVRAIDLDSVVCGEFVVIESGKFGVMPVYRDDPYTVEDEGAEPGDTVMIYFDSLPSSRSLVWSKNGEIIRYYDLLTASPDQPAVPPRLSLHQNYPNPFNPSTTILFEVPEPMPVHLAIYTVEGKLVRVLIDELRPAGIIRKTWDGRDAGGNPAASGIYFYRLNADGRVLTKKMVLLK